jgi:rhamnosyltransferase
MHMNRIFAIIVTFNTNCNKLKVTLHSLAAQCSCVIADNSDDVSVANAIKSISNLMPNCHYFDMHGNCGIATAQNFAAARAWALGATHILLLDDDSELATGMLNSLLNYSYSVGKNIILGVRTINLSGFDVSNSHSDGLTLTLCRDLMSSGTLISRPIFESVGEFDENLFIDCVDFDWGWRAQRLGYKIYLINEIHMLHQLGEGRIGWLGVSAPIRHYYQYRNILKMLVRNYTPWSWRVIQVIKLPVKLVLIFFLLDNKSIRLKYAFAGIRDAFFGKNGKYFN